MDAACWKTRTLSTNMFAAELSEFLSRQFKKTKCPWLFSKFSFKSKVVRINIINHAFLCARPA